ncbi:MAG: DNA replication/repair protein RecF [Candidatus Gracilibacteria bacterium]
MRLQSLHLTNFRKFHDLHLDIDQSCDIICFVGANTLGKTNILEAMYFLGLLKSFRTVDTKDLVTWEENFLSIEGKFLDGNIENMIATTVFRPKKQRRYTVNGVELPIAEYVGKLNVVFFSPDDINLLLLSPSNRRKYLDILLSQTDIQYFRAYVNYQKILKQRNALLKIIRENRNRVSELDYWNEGLVDAGLVLIEKRKELIEFFNQHIGASYREISENKDAEYALEYLPSLKSEVLNKENYLQALHERLERDLILESTSTGPHRDDFTFLLNGKNIEAFASRGDTRSMILALKLNEITFIKERNGTLPLLLLDDVFSELDDERQEQLLSHIPEGIQTFITSTTDAIGSVKKRKKDICFVNLTEII